MPSTGAARRVLQVVTDTDRRGAQVFACDLGAALQSSDTSVRTAALTEGRIGGLPVPVLGPSRRSPRSLFALRRELGNADVVIAHGSATLPACALATLATSTPFVYRQISDSLFWAATRSRRLRVRAALARAKRVVALWSGSAKTLVQHFGVPTEKITVIPNGVRVEDYAPVDVAARHDARRALGLDGDRPVVLYVGALVPEKGVDVAIDALRHVEDARLLIVGDGPDRARLADRARGDDRMVFHAPLDDVRMAYAAADAVVLPSRGGDSMPAVLIEAGLCGLPAVATPIEAIPEIVVDGVTGALVPRDDPTELGRAVGELLHDPDRAARLGACARDHCLRSFSIERVVGDWKQVIEEVVATRR